MGRRFLLLLFLLVPGLGAASARDDVLALLQGYEWTLDEERFAALPSGSYRELLSIAAGETYAPFLRGRAALALSLYPNREVLQFFIARVRDGSDPLLRRDMVQAFCKAFARQEPGTVAETMVPLLDEADAHLRIGVARCLRELGSASADAAVDRYRARITEPWESRATQPE